MNQEGKDLVRKERKKYLISCFVSHTIGLAGLFYIILRTYEMDDWIKVITIILAVSFAFLGFYAPIRGYTIAGRIVFTVKKSGNGWVYELASGKSLVVNNDKMTLEREVLSLFSRTSDILKIMSPGLKPLIILTDFWAEIPLPFGTSK